MPRVLPLVAACLALGCLSSHAPAVEPLFAKYGTGTLLHPIEEPERVAMPACYKRGPCHCAKEHVYIYAVNGLNPMCLGNFNGLCQYWKKQGFANVRFGQLYTWFTFADEIKAVRASDPQARIALVGYSLGANSVRDLANDLNKEGVPVDLLVYLAGDTIGNTPDSKPANVRRIVNIRAGSALMMGGDLTSKGDDIDGARNVKVECRHIMTPSRLAVVETMNEELLMLACYPG
jgi:hypothetical protein